MQSGLAPFFAPRGVALVGATANPDKLAHGILRNMLAMGYQRSIWPVNPQYREVAGLPCYPDIDSVPGPVDLAVIAVPAPSVAGVVEAAGRRGVRAAIVISGGFKEVGAAGAALEAECVAVARRFGMRLIGPNCVGLMDLHTGVNTTFMPGIPARGEIAFVSQSGAVGGGVVDYVAGKGVGFSALVSLGNEADVTETDMIEYLAGDPHTRVIAAYVEAIADGARFLKVARAATRVKPVVVLKAGRTAAGAQAVSSHTGSLAGSHAAYEAAFAQAGVIEAASVEDLLDISMALATQPVPRGPRVAIITNAGGPAALASDSLAANGLGLAGLAQATRDVLRAGLAPSAQVGNPVDMLGGATPGEYAHALQTVLADPDTGSVLVVHVPQAVVNPCDVARAIVAVERNGKPVVACFMGDATVGEARTLLHARQMPMYVFPEQAGRALGAIWRQRERLNATDEAPVVPDGLDQPAAGALLRQAGPRLAEAQARPLLGAYGIATVEAHTAQTVAGAVEAGRSLGYPVALKIISPDILHKSDAGGVCLGLQDDDALQAAYLGMLERIGAAQPAARLEGVLVEKMAPKGYEVIVGVRRDPSFGPLVVFGLGGVLVEVMTDVSFRVAPLGPAEARAMVCQTRAGKMLGGMRGQPAGDIDAVVDCILRLSRLALDFPEIAEVEINPLLVLPQGQGVLALDARVALDPKR